MMKSSMRSELVLQKSSRRYQDDNFDEVVEFSNLYKKFRADTSSPFKNKKQVKINIWSGAECESSTIAGQRSSFDMALDLLVTRLRLQQGCPPIMVEYRGNKTIKRLNLSPTDMIDWLLSGDIHYILTHPHQGIDLDRKYPVWNIPKLAYGLDMLEFHTGFPNGQYLRCPVFRQDKFRYLTALEDLALPSMQILLTEDGCYDNIESLLQE